MIVAEFIKEYFTPVTTDDIFCVAGLTLLGIWLLRTSWGTKALADSPPRRNSMPVYLPFAVLFVWMVIISVAAMVVKERLGDLADWQEAFVDNLIFCISGLLGIAAVVILAGRFFARGLKGFGLDVRTAAKDFLAAIVNLFAVWPIVALMVVLTIYFGNLFNPNFQIAQHDELKLLTEHSQLAVRVVIAAVAIVVVPVFEEMLFRGLLQTMIRSYLQRTWAAIFITSAIFASVHANAGHWPALFVLSVCMGYAYEKSGSLYRAIFIHMLFNAINIINVINST